MKKLKIENLKLKIIFMGTPDFALLNLQQLITNGYDIVAVITAPDKSVGREQILTPPPVKKLALKYKIPVLQPERISNFKLQTSNFKPDLIIVAAYGQILPKEILNIPRYGCLNVHASLLPKYRGPSPIQYAILNGEKYTGVTIILMDTKIDHGSILAQEKIAIQPNETAQMLHDKLAKLGAQLLIKTLPQYIQDKIKPKPQDEKRATYTKILTRQDGNINWQKSAQEIERQIRAFFPWPGSWTIFNKKRVKILKARAVNKKNDLTVQTENGYLLLEIVQPEGKKPMKWEEFLRGHKI